jgi:hypothetical protein
MLADAVTDVLAGVGAHGVPRGVAVRIAPDAIAVGVVPVGAVPVGEVPLVALVVARVQGGDGRVGDFGALPALCLDALVVVALVVAGGNTVAGI